MKRERYIEYLKAKNKMLQCAIMSEIMIKIMQWKSNDFKIMRSADYEASRFTFVKDIKTKDVQLYQNLLEIFKSVFLLS